MTTTEPSSWADKKSFTLVEIIDRLKDMRTKGYKGICSVLLDQAQTNYDDCVTYLKGNLELEFAETMVHMLQKEKDADYTVGRFFEIPHDVGAWTTIFRSWSERWAKEKNRDLVVAAASFHIWQNPINRFKIMKGPPDRLTFMSDLVFIQKTENTFSLGRISHEFSKGGNLVKFL